MVDEGSQFNGIKVDAEGGKTLTVRGQICQGGKQDFYQNLSLSISRLPCTKSNGCALYRPPRSTALFASCNAPLRKSVIPVLTPIHIGNTIFQE